MVHILLGVLEPPPLAQRVLCSSLAIRRSERPSWAMTPEQIFDLVVTGEPRLSLRPLQGWARHVTWFDQGLEPGALGQECLALGITEKQPQDSPPGIFFLSHG